MTDDITKKAVYDETKIGDNLVNRASVESNCNCLTKMMVRGGDNDG